jgi:hypothetical protein
MRQNYLFPAAQAIIFTLQPLTGIDPNSPRPFSVTTCSKTLNDIFE